MERRRQQNDSLADGCLEASESHQTHELKSFVAEAPWGAAAIPDHHHVAGRISPAKSFIAAAPWGDNDAGACATAALYGLPLHCTQTISAAAWPTNHVLAPGLHQHLCTTAAAYFLHRRRAGRPAVAVARERRDNHAAATKMQSMHRGRAARRDASRQAESELCSLADDVDAYLASPSFGEYLVTATRVQSMQRGRAARRRAAEAELASLRKRREGAEEEAATRMQSVQRGRAARRSALSRSKSNAAAATNELAAEEASRRAAAARREEATAATRVQSMQRGRSARRRASSRRGGAPRPADDAGTIHIMKELIGGRTIDEFFDRKATPTISDESSHVFPPRVGSSSADLWNIAVFQARRRSAPPMGSSLSRSSWRCLPSSSRRLRSSASGSRRQPEVCLRPGHVPAHLPAPYCRGQHNKDPSPRS